MNYIIIIIISYIFPLCDGFNWYHDININDCNKKDIQVLQKFIDNSKTNINLEMDVNFNNTIEPIELGWQLWEEGRLIHWICNDVPSPFYMYNYDCSLSGDIPKEVNQLDAIVKLHLQNNDLNGTIPQTICDLNISNSGNYWFKIDNNSFCPPYPECIEDSNRKQNQSQCAK